MYLVFKFVVKSFCLSKSFPTSALLQEFRRFSLRDKASGKREFTESCNVKPAKRKYMFGLIVVTIHGKKEDWGLRRGKKGQGGEVQ